MAEKSEKTPQNDQAAVIRKMRIDIEKIKFFLEKTFGQDIDGDGKVGREPMKKVALSVLVMVLMAGVAMAFPQERTNTLWNVVDTTGTNDVARVTKGGDLKVAGTLTAATVSGTVAASDIAAGTMANAMTISNAANVVYGKEGTFTNKLTTGTRIAMSTNVSFFTGILTTRAGLVTSTLTTNCGIGSVYFSNGGVIFFRVANSDPDVTNDWSVVDGDNADTPSP